MTISLTLTDIQTSAIAQGIDLLSRRLDQLGDSNEFQLTIAGLSQSMDSLVNVTTFLQDGLSNPLQPLLDGSKTVAEVIAAIEQAANSGGLLSTLHVTDTLEDLGDHQILWLEIDLTGEETVQNLELDIGNSLANDSIEPSPNEQILQMSPVGVDAQAGMSGSFRIGIDLTPGLPADQAVLLATDNLEAYTKVAATIEDVQATYGIFGIAATDVTVDLDARIALDLQKGSNGYLTFESLKNDTFDNLFALKAGGTGLSVNIPFLFDIEGFIETGEILSIGINAQNSFDPEALTVYLPNLTFDDGSLFDFSNFSKIQLADLGSYLLYLQNLLPDLGDGFNIPALNKDLSNLIDTTSGIRNLLNNLQDFDGTWKFTSIQDLISQIASHLGVTEESLGLRWQSQANAIEWDLPFHIDANQSTIFDANNILPDSSGIVMNGTAEGTIQANLDLKLTGGVAVNSTDNMDPITPSTLLSELNSGIGLTEQRLLTSETPVDDIIFEFSDGSSLGFDLNTLTGLGNEATQGSATVGDLLALLNSSPKLTVELDNNHFVFTDNTTGTSDFTVVAPSIETKLGTGLSAVTIQSVSFVPMLLGVLDSNAVSDPVSGKAVITGNSLISQSLLDRLYVNEQTLASGNLRMDAAVEGGGILGPVSLTVVDGQLKGNTDWSVAVKDPGTQAMDGRIYFSELTGVDLETVLDHQVQAPSLDGIFQLKITPPELESSLDINPTDYQTDPLTNHPDTDLVPYLELKSGSDGSNWDITFEASNKLASLFNNGVADFSWQDLPNIIDFSLDSLEGSPLWDLNLPMTSVSLGDLLQLRTAFEGFELPDLSGLLGGTVGGSDKDLWQLGDWNLDLSNVFSLAFPELTGNYAGFLDSLHGLQGQFENLVADWEGRTSSDFNFNLDFLSRLGAWVSDMKITLGEFRLALSLDATPPEALTNLSLSLDGLLGFLDGIPYGLEDFGALLESAFFDFPGLDLSVDTSIISVSNIPTVVFDLAFDLTDLQYMVDLEQLDLGNGALIQIDGNGILKLDLDGTVRTQFGWDFGSMTPYFDPSKTSASLDITADDGDGLILDASLGALASISLGGDPAEGKEKAVISLSNVNGGANPAHFELDGTGALSGSAYFLANLPLYVEPMGEAGTITVDAALVLNQPPSFDAQINFDGDLDQVFQSANLGLGNWIEGAIQFLDGLIAALESNVISDLPVLGNINLSDVGFLKNLKDIFSNLSAYANPADLLNNLNNLFASWLPNALASEISFSIDIDGQLQLFDANSPDWNLNFDELLKSYDKFVVNLDLKGGDFKTLAASSLDLDLDSLGLGLKGDAGVDLALDYGLNLGLGFSRTEGFFVEGVTGNEIDVNVGMGFSPGSQIEMNLGALEFALTDGTPGAIVPDPLTEEEAIANRELNATLGMDFGDGIIGGSQGGFFDNTQINGELNAKLDVDLTADLFNSAGLGASLQMGYYGANGEPVSFVYELGSEEPTFTDGSFHFDITDTYIDLGDLIGQPVLGLLKNVQQTFEPLDPVLNILTSEIPLISDVSKAVGSGSVTTLDVLAVFGEGVASAKGLITTLAEINDLVNLFDVDAANGLRFSLGGLLPNDPLALFDSGTVEETDFVAPATNNEDDINDIGGNAASLLGDLDELGLAFPLKKHITSN